MFFLDVEYQQKDQIHRKFYILNLRNKRKSIFARESLDIEGERRSEKKRARLKLKVPLDETIGQSLGNESLEESLCFLVVPQLRLGEEPEVYDLSYLFLLRKYKKNKLKFGINFLNNCKKLVVYPNLLIFKLLNDPNKNALSIWKRTICCAVSKRNKELQHALKELSISENFLSKELSTIDFHILKKSKIAQQ